jgi:hypothetical protein
VESMRRSEMDRTKNVSTVQTKWAEGDVYDKSETRFRFHERWEPARPRGLRFAQTGEDGSRCVSLSAWRKSAAGEVRTSTKPTDPPPDASQPQSLRQRKPRLVPPTCSRTPAKFNAMKFTGVYTSPPTRFLMPGTSRRFAGGYALAASPAPPLILTVPADDFLHAPWLRWRTE